MEHSQWVSRISTESYVTGVAICEIDILNGLIFNQTVLSGGEGRSDILIKVLVIYDSLFFPALASKQPLLGSGGGAVTHRQPAAVGCCCCSEEFSG